jgi:GMP synthase (glutamine-hydrolysing)
MTAILLVEGDTPSLTQHAKNNGLPTWAQIYTLALRHFRPELEIRVVSPYQRPLNMSDYLDIYGAVFTGSSVSWSPTAPDAAPLRQAMSAVFELGCPVLGSCNGMQLAAVVLGGKTGASPNGFEVGIAQNIQLTEAGKAHPMMAGRDKVYSAPTVHRDEVQELPDHAVLMAYNEHCPVQAFTFQREGVDFWGTQYHPELRAKNLSDIARTATGIYTNYQGLVDDLLLAETDQETALKLGSSVQMLWAETRMLEIRNWLRFLKAREAG